MHLAGTQIGHLPATVAIEHTHVVALGVLELLDAEAVLNRVVAVQLKTFDSAPQFVGLHLLCLFALSLFLLIDHGEGHGTGGPVENPVAVLGLSAVLSNRGLVEGRGLSE